MGAARLAAAERAGSRYRVKASFNKLMYVEWFLPAYAVIVRPGLVLASGVDILAG